MDYGLHIKLSTDVDILGIFMLIRHLIWMIENLEQDNMYS